MRKIVVFVILIAILFSLAPTSSVAFAEDAVFSDVLKDLQKDESFDASRYSVDLGNNSIDIITIAEGENDELYIYTYQPAIQRAFYCSSINISRHDPEDETSTPSYDNYRLSFCNSNGVFYKYIVERFTILSDDVRFYCISQIMRPFDSSIDTQPGNGQTISEVPIRRSDDTVISKEYVLYEVDGQIKIECKVLSTIEVTSEYVGYIHYFNGGIFNWGTYTAAIDSHFVAFNTNWDIDELLDVDIKWSESEWYYLLSTEWYPGVIPDDDDPSDRIPISISDPVEQPIKTLYADVSHSQSSTRIFADEYDFKEIQTVDELLDEENDVQIWFDGGFFTVSTNTQFTSEAKEALKSQRWVLRFCETPYTIRYSNDPNFSINQVWRTRITDVIILRLHFKSQGEEYNLGVVDNKQTGSLEASASSKTEVELSEEFADTLKMLLLVLGLIALGFFLWLFSPLIKLLLSAVLFPFRLIKKLVKRKKEVRGSLGPPKRNSRYRRW